MTLEANSEADEGLYTVEVEISLRETPDVKEVATVTIQIDPCQISSFEGAVTPQSLSYAVDAPKVTSFAYLFTQNVACGYDESIEVSGLPEFMTHKPDDRDFTIFTNELSNNGAYEVSVISSI